MSYVFTSYARKEHVTGMQHCNLFHVTFPIVHVDYSVEYCEHFFSVIYMPLVRLVGPMKAACDTPHVCDVNCTPRAISRKFLAPDDLHFRWRLLASSLQLGHPTQVHSQ